MYAQAFCLGSIETAKLLSMLPDTVLPACRAIEELFLANGASIGYWRGDIKGLASDIEALSPTVFIGVPRVFDRVREGALATVNRRGPVSKLVFNWALKKKLALMNTGLLHDQVGGSNTASGPGRCSHECCTAIWWGTFWLLAAVTGAGDSARLA